MIGRLRDAHPRIFAIVVWICVTATPIVFGWLVGVLALPFYVMAALLLLWAPVWIVVTIGMLGVLDLRA